MAAKAPDSTYFYRPKGTDVPVVDGGTGVSSIPAYAVVCGGTTSTGAIQTATAPTALGQILMGGPNVLPFWSSPTFPTAPGAVGNAIFSNGVNFITTAPSVVSFRQTDPNGTTSAPGVMMGLNVPYTPSRSGNLLVLINGTAANNTASDSVTIRAVIGQGTPPSNGDTPTGIQQVGPVATVTNNASTAAVGFPFTINGTIRGLLPGTTYWCDLWVAAPLGGTATVTNICTTILDF